MEKKKLEIMAPAGNFECLHAAIQGGADSVYFGVEKLNQNFQTLMAAIIKAKPAAAKGQYLRSVAVASTMGPGVKLNPVKLAD